MRIWSREQCWEEERGYSQLSMTFEKNFTEKTLEVDKPTEVLALHGSVQ